MRTNDTNKIANFFAVAVVIAVVAAFVFGSKGVNAALPVEAGLDEKCSQPGGQIPAGCVDVDGNGQINEQDCGAPENSGCPLCQENIKCSRGLYCGDLGKCVECENDNQCNSKLLETCKNNICTTEGGNGVGGLCMENGIEGGNCFDGLKCVKHSCEETTSVAPSVSITLAGGKNNWMGIDLTIQDVESIINGLACWLTRIATAIMVIFLIIAGMRFMYARGNPTAYQAAVKNFQHVLIGILVIMAVYVIIATIAHAVGRTDFSLIPLVC